MLLKLATQTIRFSIYNKLANHSPLLKHLLLHFLPVNVVHYFHLLAWRVEQPRSILKSKTVILCLCVRFTHVIFRATYIFILCYDFSFCFVKKHIPLHQFLYFLNLLSNLFSSAVTVPTCPLLLFILITEAIFGQCYSFHLSIAICSDLSLILVEFVPSTAPHLTSSTYHEAGKIDMICYFQ